jgi:hypothetical protein
MSAHIFDGAICRVPEGCEWSTTVPVTPGGWLPLQTTAIPVEGTSSQRGCLTTVRPHLRSWLYQSNYCVACEFDHIIFPFFIWVSKLFFILFKERQVFDIIVCILGMCRGKCSTLRHYEFQPLAIALPSKNKYVKYYHILEDFSIMSSVYLSVCLVQDCLVFRMF